MGPGSPFSPLKSPAAMPSFSSCKLSAASCALWLALPALVAASLAASCASVLACSAAVASVCTASTSCCQAGVPGSGSVPSSVPELAATRYRRSALVTVFVPSLPSKVTHPLPGCAVTLAGTATEPSVTSEDAGSLPPGTCQNARMVRPSHSPVAVMARRYTPRFLV